LTGLSVTGGASQATTSIVVTDLTPVVDKRPIGGGVASNEYIICTVTWSGTAFTDGAGPPAIKQDLRLFGLTGTKDLQNGCVTADKIAPGALLEAGLGFGSVNSPAIHVTDAFGVNQGDTTQGYGVKTDHIQDQNITAAKMAPLSIATGSLQNDAVTGVKIAPLTVTATNIASHAVESPKLALADNLALGSGPQDTTVGSGVKTTHIANGAVTAVKLDAGLSTSFVAPGTIVMFGGPEGNMPSGYFPCDGRLLNASVNTQFLPLFNAIGNLWGGSGFTFNVPDLRGVFVRMVNTTAAGTAGGTFSDPQESTRTKRDGVSPQLGVGSYQSMDIQVHNHSYTTSGFSGTATVDNNLSNAYGQFGFTGSTGPFPVSPPDGAETRPKNAAVLYMIKY
jgi:microcystin-dependent protein